MSTRLALARLATPQRLSARCPTRLPRVQHAACRPFSCTAPAFSDDAPPPPLLSKLKGDLKAAMKAKDKARLIVLRSILATTLNASKTAQPIRTDAQLVALLRKTVRASQDAAAEFRGANRADLAEQEEAQIAILEGYASSSGIESLTGEQLQVIVEQALADITAEGKTAGKAQAGELMKRLLAPGGQLEGKDVSKAEVARLVKTVTSQA